jgi:ornithine cyclodeaminase/alanine dehydrogenase-like protein (mu-crystallin family)
MKFDNIKKVGVIGGGLMGRQISLNTAIHGIDAYVTDAIPAVVDNVQAWAEDYIKDRIKKGKMSDEAGKSALSKFHAVKTLEEAVRDADLLIVVPPTEWGSPALNATLLATLLPVCLSGFAHPNTKSSISFLSSCGTLSNTPFKTCAA